MPRYVVLFHQLDSREDHWDFMLESEASLATWALAKEPSRHGEIPGQMLENHRIHYLDYEGPVSGNRGIVTQWDAGQFVWNYRSDAKVVATLNGGKLKGVAKLTKQGDVWHFEYLPSY